MKSGYYSREEIEQIKFRNVGEDVQISQLARIFRPERISLGNHVRIDDYCMLSGDIEIGNHVMMTTGVKIACGKSRIKVGNYVGFGFQTVVVGEADDFSGQYLNGPTVPDEYRLITGKYIEIGDNCIFGANCTILPNVIIGDGCSFGAMSLVNKDTKPWGIYYGIPCRRVKEREKRIIQLANEIDKMDENG